MSRASAFVLASVGLFGAGLFGGCEPRVSLDFFPASAVPSSSAGAPGTAGAPASGLPELVVDDDMNLSRDNGPERTCADGGEAVSYAVAGLDAQSVELMSAPTDGCLDVGDEVLLINLQGSPDGAEQVGVYELLDVRSVSGTRVEFAAPKAHYYGKTAGKDDGVGTADGAQRVILQRVPRFSRLEVHAGASLTADAWNGEGGGVLVVHVDDEAVIDGHVHMDARGYRGGITTEPEEAPGQQGESLAGLGAFAIEANHGGGGGGIADQTTFGCQQDGYPGGGGGHVTVGDLASVMDLCGGEGAGLGGVRYALAGRLFLGSGGGSAGTDNVRVDNPPGGAGGNGGGIVWLLASSITGTGSITAHGAPGVGDPEGVECLGYSATACYDHSGPGGGGSGGSVRLSAGRIDVLTTLALGGPGGNGNDNIAGNGGDGGDGLVLIER